MACIGCKKDIQEGFQFCPFCGQQQAQNCPACGLELNPQFAFCPGCGEKNPVAEKSPTEPTSQSEKSTAIIKGRGKGERRMVTVVFADVVGFTRMSETLDPETVTDMLNLLFGRCGEIVKKYEGTVDKFIGDAAMILFGAPLSHEDDPERAVITALEIFEALPGINRQIEEKLKVTYPLNLHVGIATGLVVAGQLGAGDGQGYTVMGDGVNLASRLNDLAKAGEILVSESTFKQVQGRILMEHQDTIPVKGKTDPVKVFRVVGRDAGAADNRGLSQFQSPLVGREKDLSLVLQVGEHLDQGTGCLVVLEGSAGVGKSRLSREMLFAETDRPKSRRGLHQGRCISYGSNVPYYPWSQVLNTLVEEVGWAKISPDHKPFLESIIEGKPMVKGHLSGEDFRSQSFIACEALLKSAAKIKPQIIVLEDMHWADATSFDLLDQLLPLASAHPVLFVVIYRPHLGPTLGERLKHANSEILSSMEVVSLHPLDAVDTAKLVDNLTSSIEGFPEDLKKDVAHRSEGIPLFVEEILRSYVESLIIQPKGEAWVCDPDRVALAATMLPTSLHSLLASRIDRLDPPLRERMQMASVIGKDFDPQLVDELLGLDMDPVAWSVLAETGEITPGRNQESSEFRFANALTQEVVYATLLKTRRQEMHLAVAKQLDQDPSSQEARLHSMAWHFEQGEERILAAGYWHQAARQAQAAYANEEALQLFDRAIAINPDKLACRDIKREKLKLLSTLGRGAEALVGLDQLIEESKKAEDVASLIRALGQRAYLAYNQGDGPGILNFAGQAVELARQKGDGVLLAEALRGYGVGHEFACQYQLARDAYNEIFDISQTQGMGSMLGSSYNSMGEMARVCFQFEDAIKWYEKFHEQFLEKNPGSVDTMFLNNSGAARVGLEQYAQGVEMLTECLEELERRGYQAFAAESFYFRGCGYLGLGHLPEAAEDTGKALTMAKKTGEKENMGLALRLATRVQDAGQEVSWNHPEGGAQAWVKESIELFRQAEKPGEEAKSWWTYARHLVGQKKNREAFNAYQKALDCLQGLDMGIPEKLIKDELAQLES